MYVVYVYMYITNAWSSKRKMNKVIRRKYANKKKKKNAISLFDLLLGLRCEFYRGIIHLSFIRRNEQKKKVSRSEILRLCEEERTRRRKWKYNCISCVFKGKIDERVSIMREWKWARERVKMFEWKVRTNGRNDGRDRLKKKTKKKKQQLYWDLRYAPLLPKYLNFSPR